jgi:hypothetical protein
MSRLKADVTSRGERDHHRGKELFEIKPVILGGSPVDPANKVWLSRQQHIAAVRHWNRIIKSLRGNS